MHCSKCGFDNPQGVKFCGQCTSQVAFVCPKCGAENPTSFKFCGQCKTALAVHRSAAEKRVPSPGAVLARLHIAEECDESETSEGERKTVTALFADVKGSMDLMEGIDPEEARALLDPALRLMIDAVHRYDGYIVQSTGDGIFALFGAPIAGENHPQRALYAALRMQEFLKRYSDQLRADGRVPLQVRVGASTGEVVLRSIRIDEENTEYTPIGHSINLAARMQVLAPIGSIAVTEDTHRLCEGYFAFRAMGLSRIKGVSEPINVYEVTGLGPMRNRLQVAALRGLTKFVGRDSEISQMKRALELVKSGHGQIVAAIAEAGVGKTRLFYEFKLLSQSGSTVLEAFSVSHGNMTPYLPVIDILHGYFGINGEDDMRVRREKVSGRVVTLDRSLGDTVPYLFGLLGIAEGDDSLGRIEPHVRKRRTLEAIKRLLLRESLNRPLILIFEDLHWIGDGAQAFLNLLADSIGTSRILMLVNYRPQYTHEWSNKTYYTQLRLDPFDRASTEKMLNSLLGEGKDLELLKRLIIERTEGNPFFIEEIVQALFNQSVLTCDGGVKLARPLSTIQIPSTVQAVLASRIDRLPALEKELLQELAIIGREFPLGLIKGVTSTGDDELIRILSALQLAEFIYEQPALEDVGYVFKHALTQEVAYNSVLIERRTKMHGRIGEVIESLYRDSLDDHVVSLANHYARSSHLPKAINYLERAAHNAMFQAALSEADQFICRALTLLDMQPAAHERDNRELELRGLYGQILGVMSGPASAGYRANAQRGLELCQKIGETAAALDFQRSLNAFELLSGRSEEAFEKANQLLAIGDRDGNEINLARGHTGIGLAHYFRGDVREAKIHLERSLAYLELVKPLPSMDAVLAGSYLSWALSHCGYPEQSVRQARNTLAIARRSGAPFEIALSLFALVAAMERAGGDSSLQSLLDELSRLATEHETGALDIHAEIERGRIEVQRGNPDLGLRCFQSATEKARRIGEMVTLYSARFSFAEACLALARFEDGIQATEEVLSQSYRSLDKAECLRLKGEMILGLDASRFSEAEECFRSGIQLARDQSNKWYELRATTSLARLLRDAGRREEARSLVTEIYGWFTEGFDLRELKEAKAILDELN